MQRLFLCKLSNSVAKRFYVIRFRKYYDVVVVVGWIQGRADLSFRSCKRHLFDSFVIEASLYTWRASISFFVAAHARKYDMRSTAGRFCTVNRRNVARKIAIPRRAYYRVSTPRIISCVKPTAGSIRKEYKEVLFEQHFASFFFPLSLFSFFFFPPSLLYFFRCCSLWPNVQRCTSFLRCSTHEYPIIRRPHTSREEVVRNRPTYTLFLLLLFLFPSVCTLAGR